MASSWIWWDDLTKAQQESFLYENWQYDYDSEEDCAEDALFFVNEGHLYFYSADEQTGGCWNASIGDWDLHPFDDLLNLRPTSEETYQEDEESSLTSRSRCRRCASWTRNK